MRQKGVDILADVAEWLLSTYPKVDLLVQKCAKTLHLFETVKLKIEGLKCGDFKDCDCCRFLVSYEWIGKDFLKSRDQRLAMLF